MMKPKTLRSKILRINSNERDKNEPSFTSSNFRLNFNLNIPDLVKVHSIVMKTCSIPNTQYNITSLNNTFSIIINDVLISVQVAVGNYNIDKLLNTINMDVQIIDTAFRMRVNDISGKIGFVFSQSQGIILNKSEGNAMADVLGIIKGSITETAEFTAQNLPNLSGLQNIYIVSNVLSGGVGMIDPVLNQLSVFNHIQIDVPFGTYQNYTSYEEQSDEVFFVSDQTLGEVDLRLFNDRGQLLNLQGLDWTMHLKIYYHVSSSS
jgi:hypothetical protein